MGGNYGTTGLHPLKQQSLAPTVSCWCNGSCPTHAPKVTPNAIAARLLSTSKAKPTKKVHHEMRSELLKTILASPPENPIYVPYLVSDIDLALKTTKAVKAAGVDGIFPEFLKNLGPLARTWLASMLTYCHTTGVVPSIWREAKTIVILEPGKPADRPESYRPILLLCTTYKLLERLLLT